MRAGTMPLRHTRRQHAGISLLEVLAAMVILSTAAAVAFTWFNQSAGTLAQVKSQEAELLARNEALDYLQHLNPDTRPQGQVSLQGFDLRWSSKPVHPPLDAVTDLGTAGAYTVTLHELDVVLLRAERVGASLAPEREWISFKLQLAGHTPKQSAASSVFGGSPVR